MLKGKQFTVSDLPKATKLTGPQALQWCEQMTERFKIVALDGGKPVIAEELTERIVRRLSPNTRQMALMVLRLGPAQRLELFAAFDGAGELRNPLDAPASEG